MILVIIEVYILKSIFNFYFYVINNMDIDKLIEIHPESNYKLPLLYISTEYFVKSKNYDDLLKTINEKIDKTIEISKQKYNKELFVAIVDLKNSRLAQVDYKFIRLLITKLDQEYPNNLEKLELKNMAYFVRGIFRLVKRFIHPETQAKIVITNPKDNKNKEIKSADLDSDESLDKELSEELRKDIEKVDNEIEKINQIN